MLRPKSFNDIIGHDWLVLYLKEHLEKGTLPHFLILHGPEGLGKTAIADILALNLVYGLSDSSVKSKAYDNVVVHKKSNDYIKKFDLSVEGGKEVAKEVRAEMQATFGLESCKVIICDECHGLSDAAQDVFLPETEYISDKVYVIMLTTEIERLKASLRSRAVPIQLHPLKLSDMVKVLKAEVSRKRLHIQSEDAVLQLIAEWAECKPRTGLNLLNAFSDGSSVSFNMIRDLVGVLDVKDIVPLLASLSGSMTFGLSYISEMKIDNSLVSLVTEVIKIKNGEGSYKVKQSDVSYVRENLSQVFTDQLVKFLFGLTRNQRIMRSDVINAYIGAHLNKADIYKPDTTSSLDIEKAQKTQVTVSTQVQSLNRAPTLDDIMLNSSIIE